MRVTVEVLGGYMECVWKLETDVCHENFVYFSHNKNSMFVFLIKPTFRMIEYRISENGCALFVVFYLKKKEITCAVTC